MRKLRAYFLRLGESFRRKQRDEELAQELECHVEMHIEDNVRAGMDTVEARRQALIRFGGMESTVEAYRRRRGFSFGGTVLQDLRYAIRTLRKSPGFTAAVVLSLALGIGANTAIFSLINAVMLKFLPVRNPEQLVMLKWNWKGPGREPPMVHSLSGGNDAFSYPTLMEIQANRKIFSSTFAFRANSDQFNLYADGQAGLANGELASGEYFSGLGIRPVIGRMLADSDDTPDSAPAAVISYGYWQRRFGGSLSVVGKAIAVNQVPFTIVGVAPPEFFGLRPGSVVDVWVPLSTQPKVVPLETEGKSNFLRRDAWWLFVMGRLQPGVSQSEALAQLGVVYQQSIRDPGNSTTEFHDTGRPAAPSVLPTLEFVPGGRGIEELRNEFSKSLLILMTVVGLVLLIACANVANLQLARSTSRYKEIAVRLATGAGRTRIIRQLLTESMLLASLGGACGLGLAFWATHGLATLMSKGEELVNLHIRPDLRVLTFTAGISVFTGILFGLVPALRATRLDLITALKAKSAGSASAEPARIGLGKVLVVSQVTMSLLLVLGAGLFVRTLFNLENVGTGFNQQDILLFQVAPNQNGYEGERLARFYQELQQTLAALPGVGSSSFVRHSLLGGGTSASGYVIQGYTPSADEIHYSDGIMDIADDQVGPDFFETMGIPVILGRTIGANDTSANPKIAVVNETFAHRYFGNSNPIGRRLGHDQKSSGDIEIVGVTADTKYNSLRREVPPTIFLPRLQNLDTKDYDGMTFMVRAFGDPSDLISAVRRAVQSLDSNVPISNVRTQVEQIDQTLFQERLFARLSSFFGLLALGLACIGLYGIMSYSVARRTSEIGIRMALGARQEDILHKVLWQALGLVFVGLAIGIPMSLGVLRLISSMLFGLKVTDPVNLAAAIVFMLAVAATAGYLPARRAARVDPMVALRYE